MKTEGASDFTSESCRVAGTLVDVGSTGVVDYGFCWSFTPNPAEAIDCNTMGSRDERGPFSTVIEGLNPGTHYYFWAYASAEDVRKYGDQGEFTTMEAEEPIVEKPVVETGDVKNITATSADCEYRVISDGGSPLTQRGLCWGMTPKPTLSSSEDHSESGPGIGPFTETMTGLTPERDYYVAAYATNSEGTS